MLRPKSYLQLGIAASFCSGLILGFSPIGQAKPARSVQPVVEPETLITPDEVLTPTGAQIQPTNGTVTVKLINKTNAALNYQAVGDTEFRTLGGLSSITLQKLKTPTTLSVYRQDRGLLNIVPQVVGGKTPVLDITLDATSDFGVDKTIISIEATGSVFIY